MSRRLLEHVAVIHLAARLLHEELGLPGDPRAALDLLVATVKESEPAADLPQLAADDLYTWASANETRFWRRRGSNAPEPQGGWLGRWDKGDDWEEVCVLPTVVEQKLKEWGYDAASIMNAWTQRKWRVLSGGRNPNRGRNSERLFTLRREAFKGT